MNDPVILNNKQAKLAVIEYLLKADNFLDSEDVKNKLVYNILGYNLGNSPDFVINVNIDTIINLLSIIIDINTK